MPEILITTAVHFVVGVGRIVLLANLCGMTGAGAELVNRMRRLVQEVLAL